MAKPISCSTSPRCTSTPTFAIRTESCPIGSSQDGRPRQLTRADLERMARKLDVEGRSKLTKRELADAVASVFGQSRRRAS